MAPQPTAVSGGGGDDAAARSEKILAQMLRENRKTQKTAQITRLLATRRRRQARQRQRYALASVVLWVASVYVRLRAEYKPLFVLFAKHKSSNAGFTCATQNFSPWAIALGVSYPWLERLIVESPLTQEGATFLWYLVRAEVLPTEKAIADSDFKGQGLTPLHYLCGSVLTQVGGWPDANAVRARPEESPFGLIGLTKDSVILQPQFSDAFAHLVTGGFYSVAQWLSSSSTSAHEFFQDIFGKAPPSKCGAKSPLSQGLGALGSFAGTLAFFPELGPVGFLAAAGLSAGLGFASSNVGC